MRARREALEDVGATASTHAGLWLDKFLSHQTASTDSKQEKEAATGAKARLIRDLRATVPGRILDDDCSILVRFDSGARGIFIASQIATGLMNGLSIEVIGDKGALVWSQHEPDHLFLRSTDGAPQVLTGGVAAEPAANAPSPHGNNAAYIAALASAYRAFADQITSTKTKKTATGPSGFMTIAEGLRAVVFVDAVIKNTAAPEEGSPQPDKWTPFIVPPIPEL